MTIIELLLLLVIAAIVGIIAERVTGYRSGGVLVSIAIGFIGAVFGSWLAERMGLPEIFTLNIGGVDFHLVWSLIGAILFLAVVALFSRRGWFGLTPPTRLVFVLSVILAVLSLMSNYGNLGLPLSAYVLMVLAYLALLLGNLLKGF
jgi:uncharacterized membrane protein YeaQ/YmgE (transglycosylase-associated protein family)